MDITNNYSIVYENHGHYDDCILVFLSEKDVFCIYTENEPEIINSYGPVHKYKGTYTGAVSLLNKQTIDIYYEKGKVFKGFNFLLYWHKEKTSYFCILQIAKHEIIISNLFTKEIYYSIKCQYIYNAFIIYKDNNSKKYDYLYVLRENYISIFDLDNKILIKEIRIYLGDLSKFIKWNNKYVIFIDKRDNSLKIIDITLYKVITVINQVDTLNNIKKIKHPIYGESLLVSGKGISLWTI